MSTMYPTCNFQRIILSVLKILIVKKNTTHNIKYEIQVSSHESFIRPKINYDIVPKVVS